MSRNERLPMRCVGNVRRYPHHRTELQAQQEQLNRREGEKGMDGKRDTGAKKRDWRKYYDKKKHAKAMRLYRLRKKILAQEGAAQNNFGVPLDPSGTKCYNMRHESKPVQNRQASHLPACRHFGVAWQAGQPAPDILFRCNQGIAAPLVRGGGRGKQAGIGQKGQ